MQPFFDDFEKNFSFVLNNAKYLETRGLGESPSGSDVGQEALANTGSQQPALLKYFPRPSTFTINSSLFKDLPVECSTVKRLYHNIAQIARHFVYETQVLDDSTIVSAVSVFRCFVSRLIHSTA